MKNRKEYFMKLALKEAKKAFDRGEVPVGCVIVLDDVVISKGYNKVRSKKSGVFHAEIDALIKAGKKIGDFRLENCEMFVTLEPCAMCSGAVVNSRIKKIYIGAMETKRGFCGSCFNLFEKEELNHRVEYETGILEEECLEILRKFFAEIREKKNESNNLS